MTRGEGSTGRIFVIFQIIFKKVFAQFRHNHMIQLTKRLQTQIRKLCVKPNIRKKKSRVEYTNSRVTRSNATDQLQQEKQREN
jgi:hypothetical protein